MADVATTPLNQTPCPRCGSFVDPAELVKFIVGGRTGVAAFCASCVERLRVEHRTLKLYPFGYLGAVGVLLTYALAGVTAGINWHRLGNDRRARICYAISATVVPLVVLLSRFPVIPSLIVMSVNLTLTAVVCEGLKAPLALHKQLGGPRASLLLPIVSMAASVVAIGVFVGLVSWVSNFAPAAVAK
jgi:hypothetical protein